MPKFTKRNKPVQIAVPKPSAPDLSHTAPDSARKWRNRIVGHGEVEAKSLLANPKNWRIHPKNQTDALAGVLSEVGWVQDCIVNQRSGFVVDGHARVALAIKANEKVPVVYVDLSDEEEALILATLDPLSAMAEKDDKLLAELLGSIVVGDDALKALCLDLAGEKVVEGLTEPDACPEVQPDPITVPGDLWLLGSHRLLCGDSTSVDAVERLMAGEKADMVFTDPPYGVNFGVANHNPRAKRWEGIENDDKVGAELGDFLAGAFANLIIACVEAAPVYIWSASMAAGYEMLKALQSAGLHIQSSLVWVKNCIVLGQADYQWMHEPCWYGWTPGKNHYWAGGRALSTVWDHRKDANQSYVHPMQKPVSLSEMAIGNSCPAGGTVIDLFGGSGSTLMGCHRTERKARLMELEPKYCDVIVRRWQEFTGQEATLDGDSIGGGRTFASLAAERVPAQAPAAVALAE